MSSAAFLSHCQIPPWQLADEAFQTTPVALELGDVLYTERRLWKSLSYILEAPERSRYFHDYVSVKFGLHKAEDPALPASSQAALRRSYVHCLRHWGVDSNGPSGATLKAWVESRFGLRATFHTGPLATSAEARNQFLLDRMEGAARSIAAFQQLDLLYTFSQLELARRHPGETHLPLFRGTHDPENYLVHATNSENSLRSVRPKTLLVEFNNLSSFTSDAEIAWEFGSSVWRVLVPLAKILSFPGLLPPSLLSGEGEYLVLGGRYLVQPETGTSF